MFKVIKTISSSIQTKPFVIFLSTILVHRCASILCLRESKVSIEVFDSSI